MAETTLGTRLTEQNRIAQLAISRAALQELLGLWKLLDVSKLDETAAAWIKAAVALIARYRTKSVAQGLSYYHLIRSAETGEISGLPTVVVAPLDEAAAQTSMLVTGPVQAKSLIKAGYTPDRAMNTALVTSAKAVQRHVLNGGRAAVVAASLDDRKAVGWIRITDGHPCAFCALLAGRGPVYHSEKDALKASGARGKQSVGQPYHDGCGCTAEPMFSRSAPWPRLNQQFADLYEQSTGDTSGAGKLKAFRKAFDAAQ
jgi:hypothetical protein